MRRLCTILCTILGGIAIDLCNGGAMQWWRNGGAMVAQRICGTKSMYILRKVEKKIG